MNMRHTHYFILAALFLLFSGSKGVKGQYSDIPLRAAEDEARTISIGQSAPEIVLDSPSGEKISLSSLRGKMVLIDFWAGYLLTLEGAQIKYRS